MANDTIQKPVTDLTPVYKDPAVLKGKAILVHDQTSGDPIRFDAQQLGVVAKDLSMYTVEGHIRGARTTANSYIVRTAPTSSPWCMAVL